MPRTRDRVVKLWIVGFTTLAVLLVVYGGYVRLSHSGLSIVEWKPISGAIPPLNEAEWNTEFTKYQASPEGRQINHRIQLEQYKNIFVVEWIHRFLARVAGLVFAIPLAQFLLSKRIPMAEFPVYMVMGLLFLAQAAMGWLMVSSGLVDRPSVSHYLLAAHLLLALCLIGLAGWVGLGHHYGFAAAARRARWSISSKAVLAAIVALLLQITYGAFTSGLKAGHVSDTWPLMLGTLVPRGLLRQLDPPLLSVVEAPLTVAFIHRWLAWFTLLVAAVAYGILRRRHRRAGEPGLILEIGGGLAALQVVLGIAVVTSGVNVWLAIMHQLNALVLFTVGIFVLHRLRRRDNASMEGPRLQ